MTTASAAVVGAMYIAGDAVVGDAGAFHAVDPADGAAVEPGFQFADGKLVARAVELAEAAFEPFRAAPIEQRARLLQGSPPMRSTRSARRPPSAPTARPACRCPG